MDPIELLKNDHRKVKELFRSYEAAGDKAFQKKGQLAGQIFMELDVHATIEEEIFYPAVEAKADQEGQKMVDEAEEEHHVVHILLDELKTMDVQDEHFDAKMTVLIENVEHHIGEEEKEMLPDAKKTLGSDLEQLGQQMEQRKQHLMATYA
jgi:hemerythrin-like domain-containing protein